MKGQRTGYATRYIDIAAGWQHDFGTVNARSHRELTERLVTDWPGVGGRNSFPRDKAER
jgi:hypothetical protein